MSDPFTVQRFRGGFAIVWTDEEGARHRHTLESTDRQSAKAEARQRWEAGDDTAWTVGRIMTGYLSAIKLREIATVTRREDAWKAMKSFWDGVSPALIDEQMCMDYAAQRQAGDATVRYELSMLSTALGSVVPKVLAQKPPLWLPAAPEHKTRHLTPAQFHRFLAGMIAPHARLYALLGVFTVARPSALFDLTWDRVDFMRGTIDLNPAGRKQTAKRRPVVPMGDILRDELGAAFKSRTCEYVIERGGKKVGSIKKAFQAASQRSTVHATPYTLRHTGAVWAAEQGISMSVLAQMMGHDDDRTTSRHYARYSPDYLRNVSNAVESAFAQAMGGSQ